ncbi:MAG TPA: tetratricopeptide repeat protein [Fimbriimonas sp.]|nr:tetratricopeptide repeat protein [Fimbriimonas sp.]
MSEQSNSSLQLATDKINEGAFAEALDLARNVLVADPSNDEAKLIEAISLSQLGQSAMASEAFAAVIRMVPGNAKARFNAGVHEHNAGNHTLARQLLTETLQIEPGHAGASALLNRMPAEAPAVQSNYARPEGLPKPGIAFVEKLGPTWTTIGWVLGVVGAGLFAYTLFVQGPLIIESVQAGMANDQAKVKELQEKAMASANPLIQFGSYGVILMSIIYSVMDLIHRSGNFMWLIGQIPCACCCSNFPMQLIYMALGRKK